MALVEPPVYEVFNGFCLAAAAILLIIPGFLTDIVALALLLPWVRRWLFDWLVSRSGGSEFWINGRRVSLRSRSQTINGDFTDLTDGPPDRRLR